MRVGAVFPQTEMGSDAGAIRDLAQAVEAMGFDHLLLYDHILGADPSGRKPPLSGPYTVDSSFHEPLVTLGYLAAVTTTLEFTTGVIVLPQRQTALVAKQAAEVDLLSGGRLRLGVGTGWNYVEYEALDSNFHDRGKRQEEQIQVMRELWANEVVDFEGEWHRIDRAGLNPMPSRQIPIWLGGGDDRLLRRIGRVGDGWIAPTMSPEKGKGFVERLRSYVREADRDEDSVGIEARAHVSDGAERWAADAEAWSALGATHISMATMDAGLATPDDHIEAFRQYREAIG